MSRSLCRVPSRWIATTSSPVRRNSLPWFAHGHVVFRLSYRPERVDLTGITQHRRRCRVITGNTDYGRAAYVPPPIPVPVPLPRSREEPLPARLHAGQGRDAEGSSALSNHTPSVNRFAVGNVVHVSDARPDPSVPTSRHLSAERPPWWLITSWGRWTFWTVYPILMSIPPITRIRDGRAESPQVPCRIFLSWKDAICAEEDRCEGQGALRAYGP